MESRGRVGWRWLGALRWRWLLLLLMMGGQPCLGGEKQRDQFLEGIWETPELASFCLLGTETVKEVAAPFNFPNLNQSFTAPPIRQESEDSEAISMDAISQREQIKCAYHKIVHNYQCELEWQREEYKKRQWAVKSPIMVEKSLHYVTAAKELALSPPPPPPPSTSIFWPRKDSKGRIIIPRILVNVSYIYVGRFDPSVVIEPNSPASGSGAGVYAHLMMSWMDRRLEFPTERQARAKPCGHYLRFLHRSDTHRPFFANTTVYKAALDETADFVTGVGGKDFWAPRFSPDYRRPDDESLNHDSFDQFVSSRGKGIVHSHGFLRIKQQLYCTHSYKGFPSDVVECCALLSHVAIDAVLDINIGGRSEHLSKNFPLADEVIRMSERAVAKGWRKISVNVSELEHKIFSSFEEEKYADTNSSHIRICIKAERNDPFIRFRYNVPLGTAFVVAALAPLFGGWLVQVGFKSLAIALLTIYIRLVVDIQLPFGDHRPFFAVAYEFLLGTSVTSLLLSLLLWALARRPSPLPLPSLLLNLSEVLGRLWPCGMEAEGGGIGGGGGGGVGWGGGGGVWEGSGEGGAGGDEEEKLRVLVGSGRGGSQWRRLCSAIALLTNFLLFIIYTLGLIIIYAQQ